MIAQKIQALLESWDITDSELISYLVYVQALDTAYLSSEGLELVYTTRASG